MKKNKLLLLLCLVGSIFSASAITFNPDTLYSRWIIDSRMGDFKNKGTSHSFKTPTNYIHNATTLNAAWDYVPGLVAKAILKAWEQYQNEPFAQYYFDGIQDYADNTTPKLGGDDIDLLNAWKIYFELYRGALKKGQEDKAETYTTQATKARNELKKNHSRIPETLVGARGFFHKAAYSNQMWLDGQYMGPAMYAEWQHQFGSPSDADWEDSWTDIALQFDIVFEQLWDADKKLLYHVFTADKGVDNDKSEAEYWVQEGTNHAPEFWGRGTGWYFAALMDVLEYMPAGLDIKNGKDCKTRLTEYAQKVADGLFNNGRMYNASHQQVNDGSGSWFQLLQYDHTMCAKYVDENTTGSKDAQNGGDQCNYLESSASSMFVYACLKGIRLGVLDKATYETKAKNAYQALITNFVRDDGNKGIKLIQSCESAGLSKERNGTPAYYLIGRDVGIHNNTEGKVLGPFIMASLEYERAYHRVPELSDNNCRCLSVSFH
ncbi:MAG: glycoside hydrolase family 88 protein [Paludibacteraceae bacterium]|nr:glycoside hydrolase family 88 protein [Paludibacteraceae bacterium]